MVRSPAPSTSITQPSSSATRRTSFTFCRWSASSALARRRIADSLLTTHARRRGRGPCRAGATSGARRGGGSAPRCRRSAMSSWLRPKMSETDSRYWRVLVVAAQVHVVADVVQQGGHLQQQPLALAQAVLGAELVEEAQRTGGHVPARGSRRSGTSRPAPPRRPAPGGGSPRARRLRPRAPRSSSSPRRSDASGTVISSADVSSSSSR